MILDFTCEEERRSFLEKMKRERQDILGICFTNPVLPQLIWENLSADQSGWITANCGGTRLHDDIQFRAFA